MVCLFPWQLIVHDAVTFPCWKVFIKMVHGKYKNGDRNVKIGVGLRATATTVLVVGMLLFCRAQLCDNKYCQGARYEGMLTEQYFNHEYTLTWQ